MFCFFSLHGDQDSTVYGIEWMNEGIHLDLDTVYGIDTGEYT